LWNPTFYHDAASGCKKDSTSDVSLGKYFAYKLGQLTLGKKKKKPD
jgi:hypothetical protein